MIRLELHKSTSSSSSPTSFILLYTSHHSLLKYIAPYRVDSSRLLPHDTTVLPSMPTQSPDGSPPATPNAVSVACPRSVTPPLHSHGELGTDYESSHPSVDNATMSPPAGDNTAAGMSMLQEESMYSTDQFRDDASDGEKDKTDVIMEDRSDATSIKPTEFDILPSTDGAVPETPISLNESPQRLHTTEHIRTDGGGNVQLRTPSPTLSNISVSSLVPPKQAFLASGCPIDQELHRGEARPWEFSKRQLQTRCPSALFQPNSRYVGTQQSDRQIYNVEVTILTVDLQQCTTSGYLQICGLTPDHPTLTTFFTGEIIGGPDQKFGFRTKSREWGATDKTDMTHWARFPAWRSLSSIANKNLDFIHPSDQSPWWQQENIFMRWKEHFLVPDYKLRSIQGASFEGFYYICLNQIEGKISGIYFHSKSEK